MRWCRTYQFCGAKLVKQTALALIETEENVKYRKKYAALWR